MSAATAARAEFQAARPTETYEGRPQAWGKFLRQDGKKLLVRGVTYGTFRPSAEGSDYPRPEVVASDFAAMAANGINSVRTYTPPPRWLLDEAQEHGLRVMVGLPWEQHIAFLEDTRTAGEIRGRVAAGVQKLSGHPALLCFAVGNEIPASIVRWYGRKRIEDFVRSLYDAAKSRDPEALVTYVNFPTTEYLELPFLDLACFNVYLESPQTLTEYLAKLQTLAGNKPLLMGEVGLDSRRNGDLQQAEVLDWQIERTFAAGCAGTFVFSWTDEWHRGGFDVDDWDFGLTTRDRKPKPALAAVRKAFADPLRTAERNWPRISAVVCTYNGSRTLAETLAHLTDLDYPDYEVIVVNDGSKDNCADIAESFDVRLITVANGGLSAARNLGAEAATSEIVAFIDDDAYPDEHWLHFLALEFMSNPDHAGVGGPNLPPPGDGKIAQAVANAPGGPLQVMITDRLAEHIPGCNCAFRRDRFFAIGGFDPRFRTAGDDVDFCWRLIDQGWTIGFHSAALVWHHRRNSLRTYWKQQRGYGIAEALLERKHPDRYNLLGHVSWKGRVYGQGIWQVLTWRKWRIYHGTWNAAPYQSLYQPQTGTLEEFVLAPEWYLVAGTLTALSLLGLDWPVLRLFWPLMALAVMVPLLHVGASVASASFPEERSGLKRIGLRLLTALLYMTQPLVRLRGRLGLGLTPLRKPGPHRWTFPFARRVNLWSEQWRSPEQWLENVEVIANGGLSRKLRGGDYDNWDLEFQLGLFGAARIRLAVEEHGGGKELLRFCVRPRLSVGQWGFVILAASAAAGAFMQQATVAGSVFAVVAAVSLVEGLHNLGGVMAAALNAIESLPKTKLLTKS